MEAQWEISPLGLHEVVMHRRRNWGLAHRVLQGVIVVMSNPWERIRREQLAHEIHSQAGIVSWDQLASGGWTTEDVRRAVRRRELVRVHPRVYVHHTGRLNRAERAWAAVLWAQPAALIELPTGDQTDEIHLAVDAHRRLTPPADVRLHRVLRLDAMLHPYASPPRLRWEHAALIRASLCDNESDAVALLAGSVGRGGLTGTDTLSALQMHPRLRHRRLISAILADVSTGTESVLERGYLQRVERAHALPTPLRQSPRPGERRDIEYRMWGLVIELDGRLGHDSWAAGNRDASRDLSDVAAGRTVLRLRWRQVMTDACQTALLIATALRQRGWAGHPRACGPTCPINGG